MKSQEIRTIEERLMDLFVQLNGQERGTEEYDRTTDEMADLRAELDELEGVDEPCETKSKIIVAQTTKLKNTAKWKEIAEGNRPDDYTNHALSHFGNISDDYVRDNFSLSEKEAGEGKHSTLSSMVNGVN